MLSRRDLVKTSLRGASLFAMAPAVPGFLAATARAAAPLQDGRVLVVVQLDGGNDGINKDWLALPAAGALGGRFDPLPVIRT
jgi:uncharacterized protein (DUF1501 family)